MSADLQDPRFTDETAAREALEAIVWPNGPVCPHCGNANSARIAKLETKTARPGLRYCNECKGQFTATVERSLSALKYHSPNGGWQRI